jgi:serine/threonine-protein kinase
MLSIANKRKKNEAVEQFEREFYTLSQLAHPRVTEVYVFGIDGKVPFYTMEILDGGDLQELAPLPWKKACALLSDGCSALSLIHSRRMVHRDLSPRNVRCTRAPIRLKTQ